MEHNFFNRPLKYFAKNFLLDHKNFQVSVWANNYEMAAREWERESEMRELAEWLQTNCPPASNQPLGRYYRIAENFREFRGIACFRESFIHEF